jgi:hypothetical protein
MENIDVSSCQEDFSDTIMKIWSEITGVGFIAIQ